MPRFPWLVMCWRIQKETFPVPFLIPEHIFSKAAASVTIPAMHGTPVLSIVRKFAIKRILCRCCLEAGLFPE